MAAEKVKGTVKWFSNRKGFGFITPSSDNAPTTEDIFVHQSSIVTEKENYRTLKDGFEVEFEVITDEGNGKLKAVQVTSADGSPCPPPEPRSERNKRNKNKDTTTEDGEGGEENQENGETTEDSEANKQKKGGRRNNRNNGKKTDDNKEKVEKPPSWESVLEESITTGLESRKIKIVTGKCFLAIGDARIKLGNGGYAAFGHTSGMIAEGTFTCDASGQIKATWDHVLKLDGDDWKASTADAEKDTLVSEMSLTDESLEPTNAEDGTNPIWGEDKSDPRETLEKEGFMMRKASFHHSGGRRRRNRGGGKRNNNKKAGE